MNRFLRLRHDLPVTRRLAGHFNVPAIGFGAYRATEAGHLSALQHAIRLGVRIIDTSPNYGSEELVGKAVRSCLHDGVCCRESLVIITKVGLLQGPDLADAMEREQAGRAWPGVVKLSRSAWYCISPEYVAHSMSRSKERLGLSPDIVLLHNPEFILSDMLKRHGPGAVERREWFYDMHLVPAFDALQASDAIYGISSNIDGCRWSVSGRHNDAFESVDLSDALAAAKRSAGEAHRCKILQLPFNLLEPDACVATVGGQDSRKMSPAANAQQLGFSVLSHRPLSAIPPTDALRLGFGVQRPMHIALRESSRATPPTVALIRSVAREALEPHLPPGGAHRLSLEDIALLFALHAPHVDCVLIGMRRLLYVDHAADLLARGPCFSAEAHRALAMAMTNLVAEMQRLDTASNRSPLPRDEDGHGPIAAASTMVGGASGSGSLPACTAATDSSLNITTAIANRHHTVRPLRVGLVRRGLASAAHHRTDRRYLELPLAIEGPNAFQALKPSSDSGPLAAIGLGDRGAGLIYRAGHIQLNVAVAKANTVRTPRVGEWLVKVQPPLDCSSDAAGGIGRMIPTTLLLHDKTGEYVAFVREEDVGHGALLRCALRTKDQVAYLWAEDVTDSAGKRAVRVYTHLATPPDDPW